MRPPLLLICHRIPYPPNRGDKIRAFHILRHLSKYFSIHLGAFSDNKRDIKYVNNLMPYVSSTFIQYQPLSTRNKSYYALRSLVKNTPVSLECFYHPAFQEWVKTTINDNNIKYVFAYGSAMSQYIADCKFDSLYRVVDLIDLDSLKWKELADISAFPMSLVYRRESKLVTNIELNVKSFIDCGFLVNQKEVQHLNSVLTDKASKNIKLLENAVDSNYFDSDIVADDKTLKARDYLVFTGTMDAAANISAILWFIKKVWPMIEKKHPHLLVYFVGRNPLKAITQFASQRIIFTGEVKDVRPFIKHSKIAIAPMQVARGVQNKILEAMSMGKAICLTPQAYEGLSMPDVQQEFICDSDYLFAEKISMLINLNSLSQSIGQKNKKWIREHYIWENKLKGLEQIIGGGCNVNS